MVTCRFAASVGLFCVATAGLADGELYVGAGIGQADARGYDANVVARALLGQNVAVNNISVDDTHSAYGVFIGYRPLLYFGVEAAYARLGRFTFSALTVPDPGTVSGSTVVDEWNLAALGIIPIGQHFDAFAKAGLGYWRAKFDASGVGAGSTVVGESASGLNPVLGVGARAYFLEHFAVRAEWTLYKNVGETGKTGRFDVNTWAVGLQYSF